MHGATATSRRGGSNASLEVDHSIVNRWVLAYAPAIERRLRRFRKPHCGSVRVDETSIRIRGRWRYLYRAIDKHGEPVDFLLTAQRDLDAAKWFFRKMLREELLLAPDRIGTDGAIRRIDLLVADTAHSPAQMARVQAMAEGGAGVNRSGFSGGPLVWVRGPRLAPRPGHSSARRPRREAHGRSVRAGGGD